jgi:hypothetical protein
MILMSKLANVISVSSKTYNNLTTKRIGNKIMVKVEHSLKFVTEVDETNPTGMRLLALDKEMQVQMLESMLKDLLVPVIAPAIAEINEGGSWAILKVAE